MGNASGMVVFWIGISIFSMLFALGVMAVDPCNPYYPSASFFGTNILTSNLLPQNTYFCTNGQIASYPTSDSRVSTYGFANNLYSNSNITRGTTGNPGSGTSTTTAFVYPDWLFTTFTFITTTGSYIINLVASPYILMSSFFGNSILASILGVAFSVMNLWILVGWIRGTDN